MSTEASLQESQEPAVLPAADCCSVPVDIPFSVCKRRVGVAIVVVAIGFSGRAFPNKQRQHGDYNGLVNVDGPFSYGGKFALELNEVPRDSARRS